MSRDYFNTRAAIWDEEVTEKDETKLRSMVSRLDIRPGCDVLDVGTGTGTFVPFLLEKTGPQGSLTCLDYAENMLAIARAKKFDGNICYRCADIEHSGLEDEAFDAVVCYSVFPHFEDKPKILREIWRILRGDGRLFICHTSSRQAINEIHMGLPEVRDHLFPENDEVYGMLSAAGFDSIGIADFTDSYLVRAHKS